jgi:hypothetical protein
VRKVGTGFSHNANAARLEAAICGSSLAADVTDSIHAAIAGSARGLSRTVRVKTLIRVSGLILKCGGAWLGLQKRA